MTRVPPRPIVAKVKPVRDPKARRAYALRVGHCQCCGKGPHQCDFRGLSVHHIIKFKRSDEECCMMLLCGSCHAAAHGLSEVNPRLTLSHVLWLKKERDPDNYDEARLAILYGETLPPQIAPDPIYLDQYLERRQP